MALNTDKSKLVVRVDQNSETDLQALFDTVLKPDSKRPLQVPWSMRNLPESFFNPPSTGSKSINHSRENSLDSAFDDNSAPVNSAPLQSVHHRAHSSPASLQQTYSVGRQKTLTHRHSKQKSYDVSSNKTEDCIPLPPGWEQARTPEGQVYYLNHTTCTTTWEDPRKCLQTERLANRHQTSTSAAAHLQRSQQMRLQQLQLKLEQLEQRKQEIMMTNSRDIAAVDPFLSDLTNHSRQESGDSGLELGTSYSTPHTPEDFLNNMDVKMDIENHEVEDIDSTHDLVSTLQLGENFSILEDVQTLINH